MTTEPTPQPAPPPADLNEPKAPKDRDANADAARRRAQLREVEAERDGLAARLAVSQRREVENLIRNDNTLPKMHAPADLFEIGGVDLVDLCDDAGDIDPTKLGEAMKTLAEQRPHLFSTLHKGPDGLYTPPPPLYETLAREGNFAPPVSSDLGEAWAQAIKGAAVGS